MTLCPHFSCLLLLSFTSHVTHSFTSHVTHNCSSFKKNMSLCRKQKIERKLKQKTCLNPLKYFFKLSGKLKRTVDNLQKILNTHFLRITCIVCLKHVQVFNDTIVCYPSSLDKKSYSHSKSFKSVVSTGSNRPPHYWVVEDLIKHDKYI